MPIAGRRAIDRQVGLAVAIIVAGRELVTRNSPRRAHIRTCLARSAKPAAIARPKYRQIAPAVTVEICRRPCGGSEFVLIDPAAVRTYLQYTARRLQHDLKNCHTRQSIAKRLPCSSPVR